MYEVSRIGRQPIVIPKGVEVKLEEGNVVTVKGAKGLLKKEFNPNMIIKVENEAVIVERPSEDKFYKSLHGLTRTLIANMIKGVTDGYEKGLTIVGVGYRAQKQGTKVILTLGYSHPVEIEETEDIKLDVPAANRVVIKGIDKQKVGQFAANVREKRKPEVYKGKGIRYDDEVIRRKEGKAGGKGGKK